MRRSKKADTAEKGEWTISRNIHQLFLLLVIVVLSVVLMGGGVVVGETIDQSSVQLNDTNEKSGASHAASPPEGLVNVSTAHSRVRSSPTADHTGEIATTTGDINGDEIQDLLIGVPTQNTTGTVYLFYGPLENEDIALQNADAIFNSTVPGSQFGRAIESGDIDGDGATEIVIGAPGDDTHGPQAGAVYVINGSTSPTGRYSLGTDDRQIVGDPHDRLGAAVDVRDVTKRDVPSIIVGAPGDSEKQPGKAVALSAASLTGTVSVDDADARLIGETPGDRAGHAVSWTRKTPPNGANRIVVGAPGHDGGGTDAGAVHIVEESVSGERSLANARVTLEGSRSHAEAGTAITVTADGNGDTQGDLLVGAPGHDRHGSDAGAAYIVPHRNLADEDRSLAAVSGGTMYGETRGDRLGQSVAGGGDVDCDGHRDILVGAPQHEVDEQETGAAYLLYGRAGPGGFEAAKIVHGENASLTGAALAVGNVTADSAADVLVSTVERTATTRSAAMLFTGACDTQSVDTTQRSTDESVGEDTADRTTGPESRDRETQRDGHAAGGNDDPPAGEDGSETIRDTETDTGDGTADEKRDERDRNDDRSTPSTPTNGEESPGDEQAGNDDTEPNGGDRSASETDPGDAPPDDETPGNSEGVTDRGQTQQQSVTVTQTQCQQQSDGAQQQTQDQAVELSQDGQQIGENASVQANVQTVNVRQRQCQYQGSGVDNRQSQRQFLLIEFVSQRQEQGSTDSNEQSQIQTSVGTQRQAQSQTNSQQNQTQIQAFEVTFVGTQFQAPTTGEHRQRQSQSVRVNQSQTQDQESGVEQYQRQYQRVSVVYQGQEQTQERGGQHQSQQQSANASQEQRQGQSARAQNQSQTERVETEQRQQQRQNASNDTSRQGQQQSIEVTQEQQQAQSDDQRQRQEQSVNGTQAERQNGTEGEQAQTQTQNTSAEQTQQQNQTVNESSQTQNGTATVDQEQTQTQTGNGSEQEQNQSVTVEQDGEQTQSALTNESTTNTTNASQRTNRSIENDSSSADTTEYANETDAESSPATAETNDSSAEQTSSTSESEDRATNDSSVTNESSENGSVVSEQEGTTNETITQSENQTSATDTDLNESTNSSESSVENTSSEPNDESSTDDSDTGSLATVFARSGVEGPAATSSPIGA